MQISQEKTLCGAAQPTENNRGLLTWQRLLLWRSHMHAGDEFYVAP